METIYIVSGSPRSGTSMVMQMLEAGGFPLLVDNIRKPDIHNPKGYYEYGPVKNTTKDSFWLSEAVGKITKVVDYLLLSLPINIYKYKIIFMERNPYEIVESQDKMMGIENDVRSPSFNNFMEFRSKFFAEFKSREDFKTNFDIKILDYSYVLEMPDEAAKDLLSFFSELGNNNDIDRMASVVDRKLYRSYDGLKYRGIIKK